MNVGTARSRVPLLSKSAAAVVLRAFPRPPIGLVSGVSKVGASPAVAVVFTNIVTSRLSKLITAMSGLLLSVVKSAITASFALVPTVSGDRTVNVPSPSPVYTDALLLKCVCTMSTLPSKLRSPSPM